MQLQLNLSKVSFCPLEQYLAKAAWILKGPVGTSDFKACIFPMLFFKRISDVYNKAYEQVLTIIYKVKVLATNSNKPLFHGPIEPLHFSPYPKTPNIRELFTAFGWTDEISSGMRNTHKYLAICAPGATLLFYENDVFKIKDTLAVATLQRYAESLIQWLLLSAEIVQQLTQGLSRVQIDPQWKDAD